MKTQTVTGVLCWALVVALVCPGMADDEDRDRWLQPSKVMEAVGARRGMVIGDVGAGEGYFTVKPARVVGPGSPRPPEPNSFR